MEVPPDVLTVHGRALSGFTRLDPSLAQAMRKSIVDAADDCGCGAGAAAASVGTLLYAGACGLLPWVLTGSARLTWIGGLMAFFCSAFVGKGLGLWLAKRRLEAEISRFKSLTRSR